MATTPSDTGGSVTSPWHWLRSPVVRRVGLAFGLTLMVAAILMVWRQHDVLLNAIQAFKHHDPARLMMLLSILATSMILNIVLSGLLFSALMSRYGNVGFLEMQSLIASATLMNYLPLRPGLFGRAAYHKLYNGIPLVGTGKTILQAIMLSVAIAAYLVASVIAKTRMDLDLVWLSLAPLPGLGALALLSSRMRIWFWAALLRYTEFLVIALRYWAAFALIGSPIGVQGAISFACICVIASMVPFAGNGLGLREWAVGLVAPLLTSYQMELGMTADLVNRAGEMLVTLILGLAGVAWLARNRSATVGQ